MKAIRQILGLFFALSLVTYSAWAASFVTKDVGANEILVMGNSDNLKAGDSLYHSVSPFLFSITEIKGNQISLRTPSSHSVKKGDIFLQSPSQDIRKAMEKQQKLKRALED